MKSLMKAVTAAQIAGLGSEDNKFWKVVDAELTRLEKVKPTVHPRKLREPPLPK